MTSPTPRRTRRSQRTLQHQRLPGATCEAIDAAVWFHALLPPGAAAWMEWASKDALHDAALRAYLAAPAQTPGGLTRPARGEGVDRTFWLDTALLRRARQRASQDGMRVAQLLEIALARYVRAHVPPGVVRLRRLAGRRAAQLAARRVDSA